MKSSSFYNLYFIILSFALKNSVTVFLYDNPASNLLSRVVNLRLIINTIYTILIIIAKVKDLKCQAMIIISRYFNLNILYYHHNL